MVSPVVEYQGFFQEPPRSASFAGRSGFLAFGCGDLRTVCTRGDSVYTYINFLTGDYVVG